MQEIWIQSLGQENPLENRMATHSNILAWRIPWTDEPGGLESMGSQRVRHHFVTKQQQSFTLHMALTGPKYHTYTGFSPPSLEQIPQGY